MKILIKFFLNIGAKFKIFYKYFEYKIKIFSLKLDIIILKLEYSFILNKFINEIIFFYKNNEILGIIIFFFETIIKQLKKDYKNLRKNIKTFKLFHKNMHVILWLIYLFLFFAGIIPFIYYILFLYFSLKYSVKYIFLMLDIYIYNFYDYKYDEDYNLIIKLYMNIKNIITFIFILINKYYIKIDKFLFRMERKKKLEKRIIELRISIGNKYVELAQRYIDKFDNFILIRFPELGLEFELYLFDLLIKFYILKARLIKKKNKLIKKIKKLIRKIKGLIAKIKGLIGKKRRKIKRKINHYLRSIRKMKREVLNQVAYFFHIIKYYLKDNINFFYFKIRKKLMNNIILPFFKILYLLKLRYYRYRDIFRYKKFVFYLYINMILLEGFWDYIYYLYIYILYFEIKAIIYYIFPGHPFIFIFYIVTMPFSTLEVWIFGVGIRIKRKIYQIKIYFLFKILPFRNICEIVINKYFYKFLINRLRSLYKKIFVNIIVLLKLIFIIIICFIRKFKLINKILINLNFLINFMISYNFYMKKSVILHLKLLNYGYYYNKSLHLNNLVNYKKIYNENNLIDFFIFYICTTNIYSYEDILIFILKMKIYINQIYMNIYINKFMKSIYINNLLLYSIKYKIYLNIKYILYSNYMCLKYSSLYFLYYNKYFYY